MSGQPGVSRVKVSTEVALLIFEGRAKKIGAEVIPALASPTRTQGKQLKQFAGSWNFVQSGSTNYVWK